MKIKLQSVKFYFYQGNFSNQEILLIHPSFINFLSQIISIFFCLIFFYSIAIKKKKKQFIN